jgi:hypothetical protein
VFIEKVSGKRNPIPYPAAQNIANRPPYRFSYDVEAPNLYRRKRPILLVTRILARHKPSLIVAALTHTAHFLVQARELERVPAN